MNIVALAVERAYSNTYPSGIFTHTALGDGIARINQFTCRFAHYGAPIYSFCGDYCGDILSGDRLHHHFTLVRYASGEWYLYIDEHSRIRVSVKKFFPHLDYREFLPGGIFYNSGIAGGVGVYGFHYNRNFGGV